MFRGSSWTQTTGVPSAKGSKAAFNCDCGRGCNCSNRTIATSGCRWLRTSNSS